MSETTRQVLNLTSDFSFTLSCLDDSFIWLDAMDNNKNSHDMSALTISFPVAFIKSMSKTMSLQEVLNVASYWIPSMVQADRSSVTLADPSDREHLIIYSLQGAQAIPLHATIPVEGTIAGECFTGRKVVRCNTMATSNTLDGQMLYGAGLNSCLDAPLLSGDQCYGTLNVAHSAENYYSESHDLIMEGMASWLASQIRILDRVKKNQMLADTDFLTGLLNRRSFMRGAFECFQDFQLTGKPFALALIDIDFFKTINDTYGHNAGDRVLQKVARALKSQIRGTDLLARFGGEEFIMLLDSVDGTKFASLANNCKKNMTVIQVPFQGRSMAIGLSIGLTYASAQDDSLEAIVSRADKLLYRAKQNGRKQVQFNPYINIETAEVA